MIAMLLTVTSAIVGTAFHFSNAWQLVINTSTTVLTFLMVFVIQNTLIRDSVAVHVKLDELLHATGAPDALVGVERLGEKDLEKLREMKERDARSRGTRRRRGMSIS